jgi:hypothetical protein
LLPSQVLHGHNIGIVNGKNLKYGIFVITSGITLLPSSIKTEKLVEVISSKTKTACFTFGYQHKTHVIFQDLTTKYKQ